VVVRAAAGPAALVSWKVAVPARPSTDAVAVHAPATWLAVALVEATPEAFVVADVGESEPPAPRAGPVKVTAFPETAFPNRSVTVSASGVVKVAPTWMD
jgi:hypothetical protein